MALNNQIVKVSFVSLGFKHYNCTLYSYGYSLVHQYVINYARYFALKTFNM